MKDETRCVSAIDLSIAGFDSLTTPIFRASTIRYPDATAFAKRFERGPDDYVYGLYGTPTHRYLEKKITELEAGARTVLAPSGQAAITCAMFAFLRAGDRVLIPDTVYGPVRDFATRDLSGLGIFSDFYDPCDLDALASKLGEPARLVWLESPGSLTMEMQDLAAISALARQSGALVGCDNTWASPLNFQPLLHGADIVVEAISKHMGGHSDLLMGSITVATEELGLPLKAFMGRFGINVSPDDCALVMRGIETLAVRMQHAGRSALRIAGWLQDHPLVKRVFYPALDGDPGHAIWARDFKGAAGVFSFELADDAEDHILPALDALRLIAIGASWGGTKSLLAPVAVKALRTAKPWTGPDLLLRINVGMEATDDLVADLSRFFDILQTRISAEGERPPAAKTALR